MSEREKLKKLATAATPGPWEANGSQWQVASTGQDFEGKKHHVSGNGYAIRDGLGAEPLADAEYIAAANPSTILALLAQLEASEAALRTLRQAAERVMAEFHDPELVGVVATSVMEDLAAALAAEGGK